VPVRRSLNLKDRVKEIPVPARTGAPSKSAAYPDSLSQAYLTAMISEIMALGVRYYAPALRAISGPPALSPTPSRSQRDPGKQGKDYTAV
jgi:hypothetical protein